MRPSARYTQKKSPKPGYFANVTGCEDKQTGALVAVKQLKKEHRDNSDYIYRFCREVALLDRLAPHPYIVPVLDRYLDGEDYWYVMPFATCNLGEFLDRHNGTLTSHDRLKLFDAVLDAMRHAHRAGVLHRDLAPTNILLYLKDGAHEVRVADFGLGRDMASLSAHTRTAQDGYGHAYFTAPEQLDGLKNATFKSDLFSLGKILNYVCTGRIPRVYIPCEFGPVIRKATEDNPDQRHADIDELYQAYTLVKELLTRKEELTAEERIAAYADGTRKIDWLDFHRFAVAGEHHDHVYYDYLEPVCAILGNCESVAAYYAEVQDAVGDFVNTFIDRVRECLGTVRWPFKSTDNFGYVLDNVYRTVNSPQTKIECLRELWGLAYESDQWNIQHLVQRLFTGDHVPPHFEMDVAAIIQNSRARLNSEQVRKLSGTNLPRAIRVALKDKVS